MNQYGHVAYTRVLMPGRHEGLDLSEKVIEFLSVHIKDAAVKKINVCKVLTQMLNNRTPGSMLQRLEQPDARAVATHEIESLLVLLSMAFFPSSEQMTFSFSWNDGRGPYLYGSTKVIDNVSYIKSNPLGCKTVAAYGSLNTNTIARLSTCFTNLCMLSFAHSDASAATAALRILIMRCMAAYSELGRACCGRGTPSAAGLG